MTYDALMDGRAEQLDLEYEAEQIRMRAEARTAFAKVAAQEARQATIAPVNGLFVARAVEGRLPRRVTLPPSVTKGLSTVRAAQVAHARATIATLGTDGYAMGGGLG